MLHDALHVRQKAHVEHAVDLVEHQHVDSAQGQVALFEEVEQPARRGHDHIDSPVKILPLPAVAHAAVNHGGAQVGELAEVTEGFLHLHSQLAGGLEDEATQRSMALEALQNRQGKGGRLASAGLGGANHIAAGEHHRDGLHLNGSRLGVAHLLHRVGHCVREPELGEQIVHCRHFWRRDGRRMRRHCGRLGRRRGSRSGGRLRGGP